MTRIITVTSGASGVGKTAIAINLAAQLAQHGQRVCLLDADWGLSSVSPVLGLRPPCTLRELLLGEATLDQVLVRNCHGFDVLPGCPGDHWAHTPSTAQLLCLADVLRELAGYDTLLIDTASAMPPHVQALLLAGPETLLVITPDSSSLTEAYTQLKRLYAAHYTGHTHIVVNFARNHTVGRHTYDKFREVSEFYLAAQLPLSGILADDPHMHQALRAQQPLLSRHPDAAVTRDTRQLAEQLLQEQDTHAVAMQDFIAQFLHAAGVPATEATAAMSMPDAPGRSDRNLHRQLDSLFARVDRLIAENERLRTGAAPQADMYMLPHIGKRLSPERCNEVCVAMDTRAEQVTVQGETFSIYYMPRSNGDPQRFACHSLDDDLQQPEPQTTSS